MPRHLVMIAFGPARVTRRAVDRARALLDPADLMTVVPAWEHARRGLGALRSPFIAVTEAVGTAALRAVLEETTGRVLLMHDDAALTAGGLAALELAHDATGALAIPHSNELETTGYVGSLPEARSATRELDRQREATGPTRPAQQFRTSCVLGRGEQVLRLVSARLTDPRALVRRWHEPVVVAKDAVAAHDSSCAGQYPEGVGPDGRPLLVAALIVRDEEAMLGDCLASLEGLVDHVVVGDTGSVDHTVQIARESGAQVIDVPWTGDFAAARNAVLEHCRDSWFVFQVDADERVVCDDPHMVRRRLAADVNEAPAFRIRIDNLIDGQAHTSFEGPRLFAPQRMAYRGTLHETPAPVDGRPTSWVTFGGLHLTHLGYDPAVVAGRDKKARNVEIARRTHEAAPSADTAMNLLRSLAAAAAAPDERQELAQGLLDEEALQPEARAHVLGILGGVLADTDSVAARAAYREALALAPGEDLIARRHAELAFTDGDLAAVIDTAARRRAAEHRTAVFRSPIDEAAELHHVALAHLAQSDVASARATVDDLLALETTLTTQAWTDVVSVLALGDESGRAGLPQLVGPAVADTTGAVIDAVRQIHPGATTAEFALAVVRGGNTAPPVVKIGLITAIVAGHEAAARELAEAAHVLETAVIDRLVELATAKGLDALATALASNLLLGV